MQRNRVTYFVFIYEEVLSSRVRCGVAVTTPHGMSSYRSPGYCRRGGHLSLFSDALSLVEPVTAGNGGHDGEDHDLREPWDNKMFSWLFCAWRDSLRYSLHVSCECSDQAHTCQDCSRAQDSYRLANAWEQYCNWKLFTWLLALFRIGPCRCA